jgi:hypothetical protein
MKTYRLGLGLVLSITSLLFAQPQLASGFSIETVGGITYLQRIKSP